MKTIKISIIVFERITCPNKFKRLRNIFFCTEKCCRFSSRRRNNSKPEDQMAKNNPWKSWSRYNFQSVETVSAETKFQLWKSGFTWLSSDISVHWQFWDSLLSLHNDASPIWQKMTLRRKKTEEVCEKFNVLEPKYHSEKSVLFNLPRSGIKDCEEDVNYKMENKYYCEYALKTQETFETLMFKFTEFIQSDLTELKFNQSKAS